MKTTINFRISGNQKEQLQNLADLEGVKISELIRKIINDYLSDLGEEEDFSSYDEMITLQDNDTSKHGSSDIDNFVVS